MPVELRVPKVDFSRGDLLDLVLRFEDLLRQLVAQTMRSSYGDGWPEFLPAELKERLELARKQALGRRWGPERGNEVLNFATLGDMETIIAGRWKLFEPIFQDKHLIGTKLMELRLHRNALAHGAVPTDEDKLRTLLIVRDISQRFPEVLLPALSEVEGPVLSEADTDKPLQQPEVPEHHGSSRIRAQWIQEAASALFERDDLELVSDRDADLLPVFAVKNNGRVAGWVKVGQTSIMVYQRDRGTGVRIAEAYSSTDLSLVEHAIQSLRGPSEH